MTGDSVLSAGGLVSLHADLSTGIQVFSQVVVATSPRENDPTERQAEVTLLFMVSLKNHMSPFLQYIASDTEQHLV